MDNKKLLTVEEVAYYLTLSPQTIRRWIKDGYIKSTKIGRKHFIAQRELDRLLEQEDGDARADEELERKALS